MADLPGVRDPAKRLASVPAPKHLLPLVMTELRPMAEPRLRARLACDDRRRLSYAANLSLRGIRYIVGPQTSECHPNLRPGVRASEPPSCRTRVARLSRAACSRTSLQPCSTRRPAARFRPQQPALSASSSWASLRLRPELSRAAPRRAACHRRDRLNVSQFTVVPSLPIFGAPR